jgi:hypothetical protein
MSAATNVEDPVGPFVLPMDLPISRMDTIWAIGKP